MTSNGRRSMKTFQQWLVGAGCLALSSMTMAGDPKAAPDVVGRDLAVWGLGSLGHVGFLDGGKVIEVLNATPVMQANPLIDFKSRSRFWGARYGKGASQALQIINAGWAQRNFNPIYTYTAQSTEGGTVQSGCGQYDRYGKCARPIYSVRSAVFRCDTFVNYAFGKGTGQPLISNWSVILPSILYTAMPSAR